MKPHEYWVCPTCKHRYWTLYPRTKYHCEGCFTRCIPIGIKTYCKPDGKKGLATAMLDSSNPNGDESYTEKEFRRYTP